MTSLARVRSLARAHAPLAIQTLAGIARNGTQDGARVQAAIALLDRGFGKPGLDDEAAETLTIVVRKIFEAAPMTTVDGKLIEGELEPPPDGTQSG
jgi:hypothetical protein